MITSPISKSSKSVDRRTFNRSDLVHACMRNQLQVHDLLIRAVDASGMTRKEFAKCTGIDEATLSRILSQPKNMELNTISKIVYAACRATLAFTLDYPRSESHQMILSLTVPVTTSTIARKYMVENNAVPLATGADNWTGFAKTVSASSDKTRALEVQVDA